MSKQQSVEAFVGPVAVWSLGNAVKPRKYTAVTMTYRQLRQSCFVTPFDHKKGKGWQRKAIQGHVSALRRDMLADHFTPAALSAGLQPSQEKELEFFNLEGRQHVRIKVKPNEKLPLIDGGHRWLAVETEFAAAKAAGDEARMETIDSQEFVVQIYLDSHHLQTDFMRLQMGRAMDRNQMKSMALSNDLIPEEQLPFAKMAHEVATNLNESTRGFLTGQIRFDSSDVGGRVSFNSITTPQSSDLSTSIFGGCKIALAHGKDAKWLTETYLEAWEALTEYADHEEDRLPEMLQAGRMLCPTLCGGKRGPTHFIVAIGNMLAWRKAFLGRDKASTDDMALVATVATNLFSGDESFGWSGDDKRQMAREFASNFFGDIVLQPGEAPSTSRCGGVMGVPLPLLGILSPGTFKIDATMLPGREKRPRGRPRKVQPDQQALPLPLDDEPEPEPKPKAAGGKLKLKVGRTKKSGVAAKA